MVLLMVVVTGVKGRPLWAQGSNPRAVAVTGVSRVEGQEVKVEVWVAVYPGENAAAVAQETLRRVYPEVRQIDSAEFATTGLVWDVFKDADTTNDKVAVNYNSKGVAKSLSSQDHRSVWWAAQGTWSNVAGSSFKFSDGGNTSRCPSLVKECRRQKFDGFNDVGWLDIKDPRVLGVTWFGTSIDEFDMVLDNRNFTWYAGDVALIPATAYDVETVWLHEFGHGLGLGHSGVEGAVMEPYYEGGRRSLHQDDINGLLFLYPVN